MSVPSPAELLMAHVEKTGHNWYALLSHFGAAIGECYVCDFSTAGDPAAAKFMGRSPYRQDER